MEPTHKLVNIKKLNAMILALPENAHIGVAKATFLNKSPNVCLEDEDLRTAAEEMLDNETEKDIDTDSYTLGFLACGRRLREIAPSIPYNHLKTILCTYI